MYGIKMKQVHASRRSTWLVTLNHSLTTSLLITEHAMNRTFQPHLLLDIQLAEKSKLVYVF
jgi:hypothetical protein